MFFNLVFQTLLVLSHLFGLRTLCFLYLLDSVCLRLRLRVVGHVGAILWFLIWLGLVLPLASYDVPIPFS